MSKRKTSVTRRKFLEIAAGGATALTARMEPASAQQLARPEPGPAVDVMTTERPGADYMVDVIKSLGIEYIATILPPVSELAGILHQLRKEQRPGMADLHA